MGTGQFHVALAFGQTACTLNQRFPAREKRSRVVCIRVTLMALFLWGAVGSGPSIATPDSSPPAKLVEEGIHHFEAGRFKDAEGCFRKARKDVEKEGREELKRYLRACKGGKKIAVIEKAMKRKRWRWAYLGVVELFAKFGDTPLVSHLVPLRKRIEAKLFVYLATYEKNGPKYEPDSDEFYDDASVNDNPAFVRSGRASRRWVPRTNPDAIIHLPLANFHDLDLESFAAFEFSAFNPEDEPQQFLLIFHQGNLDKIAYNNGSVYTRPCLHRLLNVTKKGWNEIRIEIPKDLRMNGNIALPDTEAVVLVDVECAAGKKTVYIDDVRLARQ